MPDIILSDKYKHFIRHNAKAEALEGTTAAGKTTVGVIKFMLKVAKSNQKLHFIASKTVGDCEKNIIQSDLGIIDIFSSLVIYRGNGDSNYKIPHLKYRTKNGEKIIFILGYSSKEKWEKALGSQFGCGFIDEINTADVDFIQEATMRCDYWMCTMNPDNPDLPVYKRYINRFRALAEYEYDTPKEIREYLIEPEQPNWTYWFFHFDHNAGLSEEKKEQIKSTVAIGTKLYKNKIQGLRGRAEGLVFSMFDRTKNVISSNKAKKMSFRRFTCGVDTSYSEHTEDTISFVFGGITNQGEYIVLKEEVYNNKENKKRIAPSDVAVKLHNFLNQCSNEWGFCKYVYIDNADQATIMELNKYKNLKGLIYNFISANKTIRIIDRIQLMSGWFKDLKYLVVDDCVEHIKELNIYSWKEDKDEPEDRNDHTINASQYAFIPHINSIGILTDDNSYDALSKVF
ncbi:MULTISPECIES: terminase large subunit domain-containing protein [unclassified Gemella]|uniref:terminase large subunit domain-containing protein n=1 Tax=unclassified Gemella TaxID=2624949 RepID=UPI001C54D097|nr:MULTISPECIES: terminase family protein [unclassified Gemella]